MTIAIGLISKQGGIVLASDSQTTWPGGPKSFDCQKITKIRFPAMEILVAQAGVAELADKAVDIMQRKAASAKSVETVEDVIEIASQSVREIRNHFWELNHLSDFSEKEGREFFLDHEFHLLLGFYCKKQPHLFTLNLSSCIPILVRGLYKGIGIGADLGEYLIREYAQADPGFNFPHVVATSVVKKVIDNIDGCGHPIWVGFTFPTDDYTYSEMKRIGRPVMESRCNFLGRDEIDMVLEALRVEEEKERSGGIDRLRRILDTVNKRREERIKAETKRLEDELNSP